MLAWMDLEMTGLEPDRHVIVEIATLITDDSLTVIAEGPDLVIQTCAEDLAQMGDFVTEMHRSSGLLDQIYTSTTTLAQAAAETMTFLRTHITEEGTVPLCGNSIGTDRRFLAAYLPELEAFFHYRSVDVSTIKELARRWYPSEFATITKETSNHRALDDIRASVAELATYRDKFFLPLP